MARGGAPGEQRTSANVFPRANSSENLSITTTSRRAGYRKRTASSETSPLTTDGLSPASDVGSIALCASSSSNTDCTALAPLPMSGTMAVMSPRAMAARMMPNSAWFCCVKEMVP